VATRVLSTSSGLVTAPGVWTRNEASLSAATNVDVSQPGYVAKRRGYDVRTLPPQLREYSVMSSKRLDDELTGAVGNPLVNGAVVSVGANDNSGTGVSLRYGPRSGAVAWGQVTAINVDCDPNDGFAGGAVPGTQRRTRLAPSPDGNFDCLSAWSRSGSASANVGIAAVRSYTGNAAEWLGVPRGMGIDRRNIAFGGGGFLDNNHCCRYAVIFVRGNPLDPGAQFGSPGMTSVVTNASGSNAQYVEGRILLPTLYNRDSAPLPADTYTVQLYRSATQPTSLGEPPSELSLVFEKLISATDISNGYVEFRDIALSALRGANLYTNPLSGEAGFGGQRGFVNANEPPPAVADVATWAQCLWGADISYRLTATLQMLTTPTAPETVTIAGVVYMAAAGAPSTPEQFTIATGGTVSENIRDTCLNLVDSINRSPTNTKVWAYYTPGQAGRPGTIEVHARIMTANPTPTFSAPTKWRSATTADEAVNGLVFSKPLEPHAFPPINRLQFGQATAAIMRIVPYRDSLFIFKEDGLFRLTGTSAEDFAAQEFDLTFRLLSRDSIAVTDDAVYAVGLQGIARISDGGVEYIDLPVKDRVNALLTNASLVSLRASVFAVANTQDGNVHFWFPATSWSPSVAGMGCVTGLAYNTRTQLWARLSLTGTGARAGPHLGATSVGDGRMMLGIWAAGTASGASSTPGATWLWTERRDFSTSDYTDPSLALSSGNPTMAAAAVVMVASWRPMAAPELGGCQWLRARVECAAAQDTISNLPSDVLISFDGDFGSDTGGMVPSAGNIDGAAGYVPGVYVAPVPLTTSRTHALTVTVRHEKPEGCWIVAASVDFRPYSTKGIR
jgi:hypothetical protein